jgi:hypothetical protein
MLQTERLRAEEIQKLFYLMPFTRTIRYRRFLAEARSTRSFSILYFALSAPLRGTFRGMETRPASQKRILHGASQPYV